MLSRRSVAAVAVAALTVPAVAIGAGPAGAQSASWHVAKVLSKNFVGPLQIEVAAGHTYVADSFTSIVRKVGSKHIIVRGPNPQSGGDLAGVAVDPAGSNLAYLTSNASHSSTHFTMLHKGKVVFVRNLARWEKKHNPDGRTRYGVDHASSCVRKALTNAHIPVSYKGQLDSHPYAVAFLGHGRWAVADAGANDVLTIDTNTGRVATAGVLPRQALKVTKTFAKANKLPSCVVGVTYYTEPVPTDVEAGPNGMLYVSALPGGPEGPGVPARGKVYTISPNGTVHRIGHGFADATNLAVTPQGDVYVAELGAGVIAELCNGRPHTVVKLPAVAAVEYKYGSLWAATAPAAIGGSGPGEIVKITH